MLAESPASPNASNQTYESIRTVRFICVISVDPAVVDAAGKSNPEAG
jgi:hypothetical protein